MRSRFFIRLPDPTVARGEDAALSFQAHGAEAFASELEAALRSEALFERWRLKQADPDEVDQALGVTDPSAWVTGSQVDLAIDLIAETDIPGKILQQRLRWLAGSGWQLRDVRSA